jgi:hypothetical protein
LIEIVYIALDAVVRPQNNEAVPDVTHAPRIEAKLTKYEVDQIRRTGRELLKIARG